MSYIEKKYYNKISEVFDSLSILDNSLLNELNKKSVKNINEVAKLCAEFNHNVNIILKKYYPEIREMKDKLKIKSYLKFYYDLIFKLTDLVKHLENYQKVDQEYYDKLIEFINDKEQLISGKYKTICAQELTAFYDQNSRDALEKVLLEKIEHKSRQFFTFGSLEEESKKIAKLAGAKSVNIIVADKLSKEDLDSAQSIIIFESVNPSDLVGLDKIGIELKNFLESKKYKCLLKDNTIITDGKLLPD
ncbi:MAG: hypothetical protein ACFFE5_10155 [Candidatus Thorarchaeota archaeon]